jgi:menaquinone-dependent protoporphyrinogen oxidase
VSGTQPESDPAWRAEAESHVAEFLAATGWRPVTTATFAGALRYPRYGPITRFIMKLISRSHGGPTDTHREYEFTDWMAVARFADQLRELLAPVAV